MSGALKISATVIVQNEADNIRDCLASLDFVDEIIVVDGGSTDDTDAICRSFPSVRFFTNPWPGFGQQKNHAATLARHDWILNIDADERVSRELRDEICALDLDGDAADVFTVKRLNHFGGRPIRRCGLYPDRQKRLYHRERAAFSLQRVHESVSGGTIAHLRHHLLHYTYADFDDFRRRADRYATLAAQQMVADGTRPDLLDVLLRPIATFLKMYLLKGGVAEGATGLVLSLSYAHYTFLKYLKGSGLFPGDAQRKPPSV